jgi:hypothetical protein
VLEGWGLVWMALGLGGEVPLVRQCVCKARNTEILPVRLGVGWEVLCCDEMCAFGLNQILTSCAFGER